MKLDVVDLVLCFCTEHHSREDVQAAAQEAFPSVPFAANTTHGGVLTEGGTHACCDWETKPAVLALWAIRDSTGAFAVASASSGGEATHEQWDRGSLVKAAAVRAASEARARIEALREEAMTHSPIKPHEELIWLLTSPGDEVHALRGIHEALPPASRALVLGSSSADEALQGRWWQLAVDPHAHPSTEAATVVIIHLQPSLDMVPIFTHGYAPTTHVATVAENGPSYHGDTIDESLIRTLKPGSKPDGPAISAAHLYNTWAGDSFADHLRRAREAPGNMEVILAKSAFFPLGAAIESDGGDGGGATAAKGTQGSTSSASDTGETYRMLHPAFITSQGDLMVFGNAPVGTELTLLCGTPSGNAKQERH